jgi:hypothetical protein
LSTTTPKVGDTVTVTYGGGVNPDAEDQITARTSTTCIGNCPPPGQNGNNPGVSGSFSFTVPAEGAGDVHQVIWQYVVADERANPGPGCDSHSCTRNFSVEV